jgi:hypothetical protein
MIFDVEPMIFPPGNVGGEFVRKVLVAGLLSKLDAGAPYNRWIFGGGLWFYSEKEAEKIPMGFDSEEGFTEMDKDCDMANGIRVEVMELKPVVVKKTSEERARGEGQSRFSKMVKCDNFVHIFHGDWITVTPDLQGYKPSNHICTRIKSRIYTTESSRYHNTYHEIKAYKL